MKPNLAFELIRCPICQETLSYVNGDAIETTNELVDNNGHSFPVINGIPDLVPIVVGEEEGRQDTLTLRSFNFQYGKEDWIFDYDCRRVERVVSGLMKISSKDVKGKHVVIVGCGSGAEVEVFRRLGAKSVIGFDLTSSIKAAAARQKENENVAVVRGDAIRPPLAPESVDIVFCDGVLPHTAEPKAVLREIISLLNDSGSAYIRTLITPESLRGKAHLFPRKTLRKFTKTLPNGVLWNLSYFFALLDKIPAVSWLLRRIFLYYDPVEASLAVTQLTNFRMYGDHTYRHHLARDEILSVILDVWPKATVQNSGGFFHVSRTRRP